jgi:glutamate synthase (NADPH/NADH) large chain
MRHNQETMYDPTFEHAACGMGFITQIHGLATHALVERALVMLARMNHRGGTGSEPDTGDGAGILMAMPDSFFRNFAAEQDFDLPKFGNYAVGNFFLPQDDEGKNATQQAVTEQVQQHGFRVLAWRAVPYVYEACGPTAQQVMPSFMQLIVARPDAVAQGVNLKTPCLNSVANWKAYLTLTTLRSSACLRKRFATKGCCMLIKSANSIQICMMKPCSLRFA